MTPTTSANSDARRMYSGVPASAMGVSAPNVNSAVSAVGPVCRYGDEAKKAAAINGKALAYSPMYAGTPAISA